MEVFHWIIGSLIVLLFLYLYLIMPDMKRKPGCTMFARQRFYAHRGLHDNTSDAPENSLRAFEKAVRAGYGIELDIQLTKDQIPVVFHDETLKRVCQAPGRVDSYTYKELQQFSLFHTDQKIPTFAEVLALVAGKVPLIVEHKIEPGQSMRICEIAAPMLKAYEGEYCIECFHPLGVRWYKRHEPMVVRGLLSQMFYKERTKGAFHMRLAYFFMGHMLFNFLAKPDFIAYDCRHYEEPSRIICRDLYQNLAVAWTVRSQEQLEQIRPHFDVYIFEGFLPDENKKEV